MQNQPSSLTFNNNTTNQQYYSNRRTKNGWKETASRYMNNQNCGTTWNVVGRGTQKHMRGGGVGGGGAGQAIADRNKTNWILKHHVNWRHPAYSNSYSQLSSVWEKCFLLRSLLSQRKTTLFNVIFQVIPSRLNIVALVEWSMCLVCHQTKNNTTHD